MKKIILITLVSLSAMVINAQVISLRIAQSNYSSADPDGAGPATGTITFRFELISTSNVLADGLGLCAVFQSVNLMETPTNTTVPLGPLAAGVAWTQQVDNRAGNNTAVSYGGQSFDRRMVVTFNQAAGIPNVNIGTTWTPICEITYWTKGASYPQGGYIVNEPGSIAAVNEVSSDGGLSTYPLESPNLNTPTALGGSLPVLFSKFEAKCTNTGTLISWATAQEGNSSRFEVERSTNGINWTNIGTVQAAGNSSSDRSYQQLDLNAGTALYRIKQVDKDGQFIYTGIERTNCQVKNISSVIYPVPAFDVLNVVIKSDRSVRTQLLVYDMQGKLVKKVDASILSGNNTFKINLIGLASGDYMLRSNDASIELNKLFTISR